MRIYLVSSPSSVNAAGEVSSFETYFDLISLKSWVKKIIWLGWRQEEIEHALAFKVILCLTSNNQFLVQQIHFLYKLRVQNQRDSRHMPGESPLGLLQY